MMDDSDIGMVGKDGERQDLHTYDSNYKNNNLRYRSLTIYENFDNFIYDNNNNFGNMCMVPMDFKSSDNTEGKKEPRPACGSCG